MVAVQSVCVVDVETSGRALPVLFLEPDCFLVTLQACPGPVITFPGLCYVENDTLWLTVGGSFLLAQALVRSAGHWAAWLSWSHSACPHPCLLVTCTPLTPQRVNSACPSVTWTNQSSSAARWAELHLPQQGLNSSLRKSPFEVSPSALGRAPSKLLLRWIPFFFPKGTRKKFLLS